MVVISKSDHRKFNPFLSKKPEKNTKNEFILVNKFKVSHVEKEKPEEELGGLTPEQLKKSIENFWKIVKAHKDRKFSFIYTDMRLRLFLKNKSLNFKNKLKSLLNVVKKEEKEEKHFYNLLNYKNASSVKQKLNLKKKEINYSINVSNPKKKIELEDSKDIFKQIFASKYTQSNFNFFNWGSNIITTSQNLISWIYYNTLGYKWLSWFIWGFNSGNFKFKYDKLFERKLEINRPVVKWIALRKKMVFNQQELENVIKQDSQKLNNYTYKIYNLWRKKIRKVWIMDIDNKEDPSQLQLPKWYRKVLNFKVDTLRNKERTYYWKENMEYNKSQFKFWEYVYDYLRTLDIERCRIESLILEYEYKESQLKKEFGEDYTFEKFSSRILSPRLKNATIGVTESLIFKKKYYIELPFNLFKKKAEEKSQNMYKTKQYNNNMQYYVQRDWFFNLLKIKTYFLNVKPNVKPIETNRKVLKHPDLKTADDDPRILFPMLNWLRIFHEKWTTLFAYKKNHPKYKYLPFKNIEKYSNDVNIQNFFNLKPIKGKGDWNTFFNWTDYVSLKKKYEKWNYQIWCGVNNYNYYKRLPWYDLFLYSKARLNGNAANTINTGKDNYIINTKKPILTSLDYEENKLYWDSLSLINNDFVNNIYGYSFTPFEHENLILDLGWVRVEHFFGHPSLVYLFFYILIFMWSILVIKLIPVLYKTGINFITKILHITYLNKYNMRRHGLLYNQKWVKSSGNNFVFPKNNVTLLHHLQNHNYMQGTPEITDVLLNSDSKTSNALFNDLFLKIKSKNKTMSINSKYNEVINEFLSIDQIKSKGLEDEKDKDISDVEYLHFISTGYNKYKKQTNVLPLNNKIWGKRRVSNILEEDYRIASVLEAISFGASIEPILSEDLVMDRESLTLLNKTHWTHRRTVLPDMEKSLYDFYIYYYNILRKKKHLEITTLKLEQKGSNKFRILNNGISLLYYYTGLLHNYRQQNLRFLEHFSLEQKKIKKGFASHFTINKKYYYYKYYNNIKPQKNDWLFRMTPIVI